MASFGRPPPRERDHARRPRSRSRPRSAPGARRDDSVGGSGRAGVKALRRQRGGDNKENDGARGRMAKSPSKGKSSRIDMARQYLAERVDPIMSEIINYLLLEQPAAADVAILEFLKARRMGEMPRPTTVSGRSQGAGAVWKWRRRRRRRRRRRPGRRSPRPAPRWADGAMRTPRRTPP